MDAFERMQNASFDMLEAFKDFKEAMMSLANDRGLGSSAPEEEMGEIEPMPGSHEADEYAVMARSGVSEDFLEKQEDWDGDCDQDFPSVKHFDYESLNADDPRFNTGLQIGIPYAVAVRNEYGQGMLIPIKGGLFGDY